MEQSRKPDLYLITQDFPYGPIEDSFVKPEYPYLCERFHVSIIAAELSIPEELAAEDSGEKQSTPVNAAAEYETGRQEIKACMISKNQSTGEKLRSLMRFLCEKDCYTEIAAIIKSRRKILQRIYRDRKSVV